MDIQSRGSLWFITHTHTFSLSQLNHLACVRVYLDLHQFITYELVTTSAPLSFSACVTTIRVRRVTANDAAFVEWVSDFSNDAQADVLLDNKFKKLEGLEQMKFIIIDSVSSPLRLIPSVLHYLTGRQSVLKIVRVNACFVKNTPSKKRSFVPHACRYY